MLKPLLISLATLLAPATFTYAHVTTAMVAPADRIATAREVIANMQAAVAKGDADAYLALVDRAEHEWWHEQKAWAKDIAAKTPTAITITPGDDWTIGTFSDLPSVEVSLTWVWTPQADDRVAAPQPKEDEQEPAQPRERELTFRGRFIERDGGLLYAGEAWQLVQREGVIVAFDPGLETAANAAAEAFAKIRADVEAELDVLGGPISTRTQRIKLYGSMRHLQHSIYPSYVFPLSGWNEPDESIKAVSRPDATEKSFIALLAHEYGHVASFELGPKANSMPWWILEGVAELMVDRHDENLAMRSRDQVKKWVKEDALTPLAELADFEKVPLKLHGRVYRQGHDMMRFVTRHYGKADRNSWLRAMSSGESIEAAAQRELTESWDDVQAAWRSEIEQDLAAVPAEVPAEAPAGATGEPAKK